MTFEDDEELHSWYWNHITPDDLDERLETFYNNLTPIECETFGSWARHPELENSDFRTMGLPKQEAVTQDSPKSTIEYTDKPSSLHIHQALATNTPHKALPATYRTKDVLPDPDENELGSAFLITNWLCDTGASAHMTPRFLDLVQEDENGNSLVEKQPSIHVEVADGHLVDVPARGEVLLKLTDTDGDPFTVRLKNVLYVPGLTQRLFSVSQFAQNDNTAEIVKNFIYLTFIDRTVTCPLFSASRTAFCTTKAQKKQVTNSRNKVGKFRPVPLETLHQRFGHRRSNTILFASEHRVWADTIAMMAPESFCDPCNVVITRKNNKNKFPSTDPNIAGHTVYMDLLPTFSRQGLTPSTTYACYLIMVDKTSRKPQVCGLKDYTSDSVIHSVNEFTSPCNHPVSVEHINIRKVKTDAGSQFTSSNFLEVKKLSQQPKPWSRRRSCRIFPTTYECHANA